MGKLTCDDCGTINDDTRSTCELCGGSLAEEEERRSRREHLVKGPIAWGFGILVLYGFFFFSSAWFSAKYSGNRTNHASSIDLMRTLNSPSEHLLWAGVLTAMTVIAVFVTRLFASD